MVIEEKTGTWCGWCPRGIVAMAELEATEPNFIGISIHNADPMTNLYYDSSSDSLPSFIGGYPYSCADRVLGNHVSYSSDAFNLRINEVPKAGISVTGYITGSDLLITITADSQRLFKVIGEWSQLLLRIA